MEKPKIEIVCHLTGFGKFNGVPENPTSRLMKALPVYLSQHRQELGGLLRVASYTVLDVSAEGATEQLRIIQNSGTSAGADGITLYVHCGVDANSTSFKLEECAYNEATFRVPDEKGACPECQPILPENGSTSHCLRTQLPVGWMLERLKAAGWGSSVQRSTDAGRFVCNYTYYRSLAHCSGCSDKRSLFIHCPPLSAIGEEDQRCFIKDCLIVIADALLQGLSSSSEAEQARQQQQQQQETESAANQSERSATREALLGLGWDEDTVTNVMSATRSDALETNYTVLCGMDSAAKEHMVQEHWSVPQQQQQQQQQRTYVPRRVNDKSDNVADLLAQQQQQQQQQPPYASPRSLQNRTHARSCDDGDSSVETVSVSPDYRDSHTSGHQHHQLYQQQHQQQQQEHDEPAPGDALPSPPQQQQQQQSRSPPYSDYTGLGEYGHSPQEYGHGHRRSSASAAASEEERRSSSSASASANSSSMNSSSTAHAAAAAAEDSSGAEAHRRKSQISQLLLLVRLDLGLSAGQIAQRCVQASARACRVVAEYDAGAVFQWEHDGDQAAIIAVDDVPQLESVLQSASSMGVPTITLPAADSSEAPFAVAAVGPAPAGVLEGVAEGLARLV